MKKESILRVLVDLKYRTIQKNRVAFNNRLSALQNGTDEADKLTQEMIQGWYDRFKLMEDIVTQQIESEAGKYDIINHMCSVKGIATKTAAKIVSLIDIREADTPSSLRKYCGFALDMYWVDENDKVKAPEEGWKFKKKKGGKKERVFVKAKPKENWTLKRKTDRLVTGWLSPYNTRLKSYVWYGMTGIIKKGKNYPPDAPDGSTVFPENPQTFPYEYPYRKDYDIAKIGYLERGWTDGHAHNAAMRKVSQLWLSHLWDRWRRLEGLPIRSPYIEEYGGHTDISTPEDYGWCPLDEQF